MKAMNIHGYFKLPDNFEGNISDALRLLADHLDDKDIPFKEPEHKYEGAIKEAMDKTFKEWWPNRNESKFLGYGSMAKLNKEKNIMEKIDLGIQG